MLKHARVWLAGMAIVIACTAADAAERPLSEAIRAAAAAVRPAVVTIEAKGARQAGGREMPEWPFGRMRPREPRGWGFEFQWPPREGQPRIFPFGEEDFPFVQPMRPQPQEATGLVFEVEGDRALVAAPQGTVAGAEAVFVRLADGRQLAAKLLGADKLSGLACLEIRGPNLAAPRLAKPDALQVGDWVLAVGGPETGGAITLGIVSAANRPGPGELAGIQVLRADLTLAEGMAGGPLVNLNGEVVGITLPTPPQGRPARELAAAVPLDAAQHTLRALAKEGRVRRGWLGIVLQPLEPEALRGLNIEQGIQIAQVLDGQPAAKAGVQAGDVILELDGRKVRDIESFRATVSGKRPGTRVTLTLLRGGKEVRLEATLGEQPGEEAPQAQPAPVPGGGEAIGLGLSVQPLTPELADQFGFQGDKGLLVTDVAADSPAAKARPHPIARGELIKEVARKPVAAPADAKAALDQARKANEKTVLILARSKEGTRYVVVDLAQ